VGGWMDGWMGGWVEVKAVLRIAYSNQKSKSILVEMVYQIENYISCQWNFVDFCLDCCLDIIRVVPKFFDYEICFFFIQFYLLILQVFWSVYLLAQLIELYSYIHLAQESSIPDPTYFVTFLVSLFFVIFR
jgi:hypothetical protein